MLQVIARNTVSGPLATSIVTVGGNKYGYCATAHPQTTVLTVAPAETAAT